MKRALNLGILAVVVGAIAPFAIHCGGGASSDASGDAGAEAGLVDTGSSQDTGGQADTAPACTAGGACTTNPSAACRAGTISCASGSPTCVDGAPLADGTTCSGGLCAYGKCLGPTSVSADLDLSTKTVTPGRTCADSPSYSVVAFGASKVSLAVAPAGDCLAPGDEVLIINLQGATGATANVGVWELLEVKSVAGTEVAFTTAKTKSYGATAGSDTSIGTAAGQQKVALVRVPSFGALTIAGGVKVTTNAWAGALGGVLALRAATLTLDGTITTAGLGYRGGWWSADTEACSSSVQTQAGESIDGPPFASTTNHFGGPGGVGPASGISFNTNDPIMSGAGHSGSGELGVNFNGRAPGAPGAAYGAKDATLLTMGSGSAGNLTCAAGFPGPALVDNGERLAGGIALVLADKIDVDATGSLTSSAAPAYRDVSASGGYVFIRGRTLNVGTDRVTARGGIGTPVNGPVFGTKIKSSDGYVVLQGTVTGTTTPPATKL